MPPKCAVAGCGESKSPDRPNLSFHKLPRNETKKRKWVEAIGNEILKTQTKEIFICSLHFEERSFNRTLGVVRLRDDAVPSLYKQELSTLAESPVVTPIELNEPLGSQQNPILQLLALAESPVHRYNKEVVTPKEQNYPLGSQQIPTLNLALKENLTLQKKVAGQKRKIKSLYETVHKQKIKIERHKAIIKVLKGLINE